MSPILFELSDYERESNIQRHEFYCEQASKRLISQFSDLRAEADQFYDTKMQVPANLSVCDESYAEWAWEDAAEHYGMLVEMRQDVVLGTLAGMYHRWDKEFREWIEHNLSFFLSGEAFKAAIWKVTTSNLFDLLNGFGWDIKTSEFSEEIGKLRLVVNVYKHGDGRAWTEIKTKHPDLVRDPFSVELQSMENEKSGFYITLRHRNLLVTGNHYNDFVAAISSFWRSVPSKIHQSEGEYISSWLEKAMKKDKGSRETR